MPQQKKWLRIAALRHRVGRIMYRANNLYNRLKTLCIEEEGDVVFCTFLTIRLFVQAFCSGSVFSTCEKLMIESLNIENLNAGDNQKIYSTHQTPEGYRVLVTAK